MHYTLKKHYVTYNRSRICVTLPFSTYIFAPPIKFQHFLLHYPSEGNWAETPSLLPSWLPSPSQGPRRSDWPFEMPWSWETPSNYSGSPWFGGQCYSHLTTCAPSLWSPNWLGRCSLFGFLSTRLLCPLPKGCEVWSNPDWEDEPEGVICFPEDGLEDLKCPSFPFEEWL